MFVNLLFLIIKQLIFILFLALITTTTLIGSTIIPSIAFRQDPIDPQVLGDTTSIPTSTKHIVINLTDQTLTAYDNGQYFTSFVISSGKWNRTPTGDFTIWTKVKKQKMSGGSKELGTYYYLPNVPNILFFYNDKVPKKLGYSIHGTYWHDNFGVPMSHGCINMKTPESAIIYDWAEVGTTITIVGKYSPSISKTKTSSPQL